MGGDTTFKCLNCVHNERARAQSQAKMEENDELPPDFGAHMDDDNEYEDTTSASKYDGYGDFMYYFDEHEFDFDNDEHWDETNGELSKCSMAIPGLGHKLCVDHDINGQHQIRFRAATNDEIDNTYYNLYGYDEYYYNTNHDDLAELYTDDDDDDDDDNYHYNGDYGYYDELDGDLAQQQRRQLSSEDLVSTSHDSDVDDVDNDVPFGYDQGEYGDIDNGYDEAHPREGFEDRRAAKRRMELENMEILKQEHLAAEEAKYAKLKAEKDNPMSAMNHPYGMMNPIIVPRRVHMVRWIHTQEDHRYPYDLFSSQERKCIATSGKQKIVRY